MDSEDFTDNTIRLQTCLTAFIEHVETLKNEDDPSGDGFTREFRDIRDLGLKMREENTYPAEEGKKPCNIKKNRYRDILPFDESRVVLDEIPGEEGSDYINANYIQDQYGSNCYIASQGPVQNTVYDFWRMIMQYRVKVIAMACKLIEMGKKKCEQYWPDVDERTVEYRDIAVTLVSEEDLAEHCTKRVLRAEKPGCQPLEVTQFHYTGWPDHDIPHDFDVILEMMAEMREIKNKDYEKAPMVIHCSAGCGRTGTICAIDYAWDLLKSGNMDENFSLREIVLKMREQRQSMIQAPEQYMMAHVTVQTLFQKHLDIMEEHTYGNVQFNDQDEENQGDSVSDAGSHASSTIYSSLRKNSMLEHSVASTIAKFTHAHGFEDGQSSTNLLGLPEPLQPEKVHQKPASVPNKPAPVSAVYEVEPEAESAKTPTANSPGIKELQNMFSDNSKAFKVERIDNIPNVSGTVPQAGVEKRYLDKVANLKDDSGNKKLSYISTDDGKKDLEARKALFESQKPRPPLKHASTADPTPVMNKTSKETNNNMPASSTDSSNKPQLQRIHSTQTGEKHITVLSVGGARPPLNKTVSAPENQVQTHTPTRSKTLPKGAQNPIQEVPQSSITPETPTQQNTSIYSVAADSDSYSSLTNYSSAAPVNSSYSNQRNSSNAEQNTSRNSASQRPGTMEHYSDLSNYSSGVDKTKTITKSNSSDAYSYADDHLKGIARPHVAGNLGNQQRGAVYSMAKEPDSKEPDSVYAAVDKPRLSRNGYATENVYESVAVGDAQNVPPPIPNRGYVEDEEETQNHDKSGAGDTNTIGKKTQLISGIKNLFKTGITPATSDHVVPSDIPGFKTKIGKKPKGPKVQPSIWNKK